MRRATALWALAVIFIANFFNYMDRMLVSAQEEPLKAAFGLDSVGFGWLWSLFTIGYLVCAVPTGLLADRYHRPLLFAICISVWSAATVATGMADSKWVLYVSRFLIGVGEAGCLIIGPALLSDYFSREKRGKALSAFYLGQPLGGTAGFVLPTIILLLGRDWPWSFYVAGWPGFLIAGLILLLPDPPRGGVEESAGHHSHGRSSLKEYLALLKNKTLLLIILAQAFSVMILVPLLHFGKEFLKSKPDVAHLGEMVAGALPGVSGAEQGLNDAKRKELGSTAMMLIVMIAGAAGMAVSGIIGDRLARRTKGAYALLAGLGYFLSWPCLALAFHADDLRVFLPALVVGGFFLFLCMPAVNTQIANVVSPAQRATAWALAVMVLHLLGDTLSPPVFGKVEQELGRLMGGTTPSAIVELGRPVAFEVFSVAMGLAGVCSLIAARTARRDIERFVAADEPAAQT